MIITDLHRYQAVQLLEKIANSHIIDIVKFAGRQKMIINVVPFGGATEDVVAEYLSEFERDVLVRHGVTMPLIQDPG